MVLVNISQALLLVLVSLQSALGYVRLVVAMLGVGMSDCFPVRLGYV